MKDSNTVFEKMDIYYLINDKNELTGLSVLAQCTSNGEKMNIDFDLKINSLGDTPVPIEKKTGTPIPSEITKHTNILTEQTT